MVKYIPLSERDDWDGKVIKLESQDSEVHRNYGRLQGKKNRRAQKKRTLGKHHR